MGRLFLGLDSSTQSLTALIIDLDDGRVVHETSLRFSDALPAYGTRYGVLPNADPRVVHAPPLMWAEALDLAFAALQRAGAPLAEVLAVSGSGQQHGSVYLNASARGVFERLDPARSLAANLAGCFSRPTSPIWMDSSTTEACADITAALGGPAAVAAATGSVAFERFTGPQIRKFHVTEPAGYAATADIALVSSFMASLLGGRLVPIDHGDASGMNLLDIRDRQWHTGALAATAPDLATRLLPAAAPWTVTGPVSPYFARKYGLNPRALNVVWSGDNPCSLVGLGLIEPGRVAISLGTSDTFFGIMGACRVDPRGEGHVFVAPTGDYMSLICFKNGSLARERVRDQYGLDWDGFAAAVNTAPPGNGGRLMLPWFEPEIVPKVLTPGVHRLNLAADDVAGNCRAVVESQMLSMRLHAQWMQTRATRIYATGGAARTQTILQIMADVNQCPVYRLQVANSAALGAAVRAAHAWQKQTGGVADWRALTDRFAQPQAETATTPNPAHAALYDALLADYATFEARHRPAG